MYIFLNIGLIEVWVDHLNIFGYIDTITSNIIRSGGFSQTNVHVTLDVFPCT